MDFATQPVGETLGMAAALSTLRARMELTLNSRVSSIILGVFRADLTAIA